MAYGDQNAGPGFREAHKCYGIKLVNEDRKQRFKKKTCIDSLLLKQTIYSYILSHKMNDE